MSKKREYDEEYKVQAIKLAKNLGSAKAAEELQIPVNTLYGWIQKVKTAELDIGCGERSPEEALSVAKENQQLKKRIKALEKENRRLSEMNEFLEDAAAFFAKTEHYKMEELKFMVWRYFMSYWSNRRICSSIGGLPPAVKRQRFYAAVAVARFAS